MDINKLKTFLNVAKYGSFKVAAEHLFLSPRAVSKQMNQIEAELGIKLFDRKNNRTSLTSQGKEFTITANDIVNTYNNALTRIKTSLSLENSGTLKFGFSSSYQATILQSVLGDFLICRPKIHIEIQEESGQRLISLINEGALDFIVTPYYQLTDRQKMEKSLTKIDLFTGELVIGISKSNPLSCQKEISFRDLKDLKGLYYSPFGSNYLRKAFIDKFSNFLDEKQMYPVSTMEQRNILVATNQGFGLYPSNVADEAELENPMISFHPISDDCNKFYSSSLWYSKRDKNPVLKELVNNLIK
ncbi:MAG: LysR family transcriptional regulator [Lactobacillus panisapium]